MNTYVASKQNLTISTSKTKILAMKGKEFIRMKIVINNNIVEVVRNFNYLGCQLGCNRYLVTWNKLQSVNCKCRTIKHTLLHKTRQEKTLKYYKVLAAASLLCDSEC
jgi:hypothetical protein